MYTDLINPFPFSPDLFQKMNRYFSIPAESDWLFSSLASGNLAVNVWEDGDAVYVEMEVPGVKAEDIDLSLIGNELSVGVERTIPEDKSSRFLRRERVFEQSVRTITLPMDATPKETEATLEEGILRVRFKKAEKATPKKIAVVTK